MQAVLDFRVDIGFIEGPCQALKSFLNRGWKTSWWFSPRHFAVGSWSGHLRTAGRCAVDLRERGSGTREIVDYLLLSHFRSLRWRWN